MHALRARLRPLSPLETAALLAMVVGSMAAIMFASHRAGHWWGDDWALYLRQAEGLLDGDPGAVIADNEFTVTNSLGPTFSPPLYPWGFPLLLVPFVAVIGTDIDRLAIVPVLCACCFACCWYALAKPRLGALTAMVAMAAITLSPLVLSWTELIQSELPFMAVTGVVLVALDRAVAGGTLTHPGAAWWPVALLGVGAATCFTVRREGLAMVAAIAAAQVALLIATRHEAWWRGRTRRRLLAARLLLPHLVALAVVMVLQAVLPSTLVPQYTGTSIANVWRFTDLHVDHLAEVVGLKRPWEDDPTVLGNAVLGWIAVGLFLLSAAVGVALGFARHRRRDLHLVVYAAAAMAIGGSFRSALNRYVCTVAPLLLLLAAVAVATVVRTRRQGWIGAALATLALAGIVAGDIGNAKLQIDRASAFAAAGQTEWGPTHPDAVAMFAAVIELSDDDDVIAAPKARAITFETGRRAVQVDDRRPIPTTVVPDLVVTEQTSELARTLRRMPDQYALVWRNGRFSIFQPNSAASAATNGAGSSSTASP